MKCALCGAPQRMFRRDGFDILLCTGCGQGEATGFLEGYGIVDLTNDASTGAQTVSIRLGANQTRTIAAPPHLAAVLATPRKALR